jgi:hypothetical protein
MYINDMYIMYMFEGQSSVADHLDPNDGSVGAVGRG